MKKILLVLSFSCILFTGNILAAPEKLDTIPFGSEKLNDKEFEKYKLEFDDVISNNIFMQLYKKEGASVIFSKSFWEGNISRINVVIGALAILYLIILALKFILAQGESDKIENYKKQFSYIILALFLVSVAEFAGYEVFSFVTDNDEVRDVLADQMLTNKFSSKILQMVRFIQYFGGGVILIQFLISGYKLITAGEKEQTATDEKEVIQNFVFGAGLILLCEVFVRVISLRDGLTASANIAITEIAGVINFVLSFIAGASSFMLILAGLYYVISFGDEDQMNRAKRIIYASIIGIVLSFSAYTISSFLVK